jgi:membrane protease YdiL (CAAX protease family)
VDWSDPQISVPPDAPPLAIIVQFPTPPLALPRVWTVFVAFVAVFAAVIAVGIAQAVIVIALNGGAPPDDFVRASTEFLKTSPGLLMISPASIAVGSAALIGAGLSPIPWRQRLLITRPARPVLLSLAGIVGLISLGHAIECIIAISGIQRGGALALFSEVFSSLSGSRLILAVLIIGLLAGTCEELLFRGYIQTRLEARWGSAIAIIITASLFGLLHMDLLHSPAAAMMGLLLGYLTARCGSIWPAIAAHVANNTTSTLMSAWHIDLPGGWGWLAGALLLMIGCILAIRMLTAHTPASAST